MSCLSFFSGVSTAKRKFADSLNDFKFQCIGDAETDDEICIGECNQYEILSTGLPEWNGLKIDSGQCSDTHTCWIKTGVSALGSSQLGYKQGCFVLDKKRLECTEINIEIH